MTNNCPILVFDIETIPDIETGKRLYPNLSDLSDQDALTALTAIRQAEAGHDFMRLPLHKVACLSFLWVKEDKFNLCSLSLQKMSEKEILSTFLRAFDQRPLLISWNGAGFDLPVLLYRMAHHKINASPLVNAGFNKQDYLNRYSEKHLDLMDKFNFGAWGSKQKLDTIASLCGFAGKQDLDGSQVVPMVLAQEWQKLATYCESDVLNTWLIYLRWQLLYGRLSESDHQAQLDATYQFISQQKGADGQVRHQGFLDAWQL